MNPVETPHLHQMQENWIVPLIFGAKSDAFIRSNSKPPQSIVVVTLYESAVPPLLKICIRPCWEDHVMKDLQREDQSGKQPPDKDTLYLSRERQV